MVDPVLKYRYVHPDVMAIKLAYREICSAGVIMSNFNHTAWS